MLAIFGPPRHQDSPPRAANTTGCLAFRRQSEPALPRRAGALSGERGRDRLRDEGCRVRPVDGPPFMERFDDDPRQPMRRQIELSSRGRSAPPENVVAARLVKAEMTKGTREAGQMVAIKRENAVTAMFA